MQSPIAVCKRRKLPFETPSPARSKARSSLSPLEHASSVLANTGQISSETEANPLKVKLEFDDNVIEVIPESIVVLEVVSLRGQRCGLPMRLDQTVSDMLKILHKDDSTLDCVLQNEEKKKFGPNTIIAKLDEDASYTVVRDVGTRLGEHDAKITEVTTLEGEQRK